MFVIVLLLLVFILLYNYYVHYGKTGRFVNLIPGPICYPIIGNAYLLFGSRGKLKCFIYLNNFILIKMFHDVSFNY